jgi:hypothetical protein
MQWRYRVLQVGEREKGWVTHEWPRGKGSLVSVGGDSTKLGEKSHVVLPVILVRDFTPCSCDLPAMFVGFGRIDGNRQVDGFRQTTRSN